MTRRQQRAGYNYPELLRMVIEGDEEVGIEGRGRVDELAKLAGLPERSPVDACHAIPKDTLSQAFPWGAIWIDKDKCWFPATRLAAVGADNKSRLHRSLGQILMDPRWIVLGSRDVHDAWDDGRLIIPWGSLPDHVHEVTAEYGMQKWVDVYYDRRVAA